MDRKQERKRSKSFSNWEERNEDDDKKANSCKECKECAIKKANQVFSRERASVLKREILKGNVSISNYEKLVTNLKIPQLLDFNYNWRGLGKGGIFPPIHEVIKFGDVELLSYLLASNHFSLVTMRAPHKIDQRPFTILIHARHTGK